MSDRKPDHAGLSSYEFIGRNVRKTKPILASGAVWLRLKECLFLFLLLLLLPS